MFSRLQLSFWRLTTWTQVFKKPSNKEGLKPWTPTVKTLTRRLSFSSSTYFKRVAQPILRDFYGLDYNSGIYCFFLQISLTNLFQSNRRHLVHPSAIASQTLEEALGELFGPNVHRAIRTAFILYAAINLRIPQTHVRCFELLRRERNTPKGHRERRDQINRYFY